MSCVPTLRRAMLFGLWLLTASSPLLDPRAAAASDEIELQIRNASQDPLRCVAVLAHFVTRDLPTLQPGAGASLVLGRDRGDGSLSYGHHGDKPLLLENLLCGHVADWSASRQDIALQALRTAPAGRFSIACHGSGGDLACDPPAAP